MSIVNVQSPLQLNNVTVHLPASKSISNRVLILNALCDSPYSIDPISDSDDTHVLQQALNASGNHFDIGAAGTSMRFLTAYLSQKEGNWTITGSERMKNRPIRLLVDALISVGADITYVEKEGYPPLQIRGKKLRGGNITLNGGVSSQYISALMMIAPYMEQGLTLTLEGNVISQPYIRMTRSLMDFFGVKVVRNDSQINIEPQSYQPRSFQVESDWSAASYWYEMAALSSHPIRIELMGLQSVSTQGDSQVQHLFQKFGVETSFTDTSVLLNKTSISRPACFTYNFINEPDLAQTLVVVCCLMNLSFCFTGLQSLRIKETDRLMALQVELKKLGYVLHIESDHTLVWNGEKCKPEKDPVISTYEDHRMAMAFAPAGMITGRIGIKDPSVVSKSYPDYWDDLRLAGFIIDKI